MSIWLIFLPSYISSGLCYAASNDGLKIELLWFGFFSPNGKILGWHSQRSEVVLKDRFGLLTPHLSVEVDWSWAWVKGAQGSQPASQMDSCLPLSYLRESVGFGSRMPEILKRSSFLPYNLCWNPKQVLASVSQNTAISFLLYIPGTFMCPRKPSKANSVEMLTSKH